MPSWIAHQITAATVEKNETAGVLLAGIRRTESGLGLLARELHWVPDDAYERRTPRSLSIPSSGYISALARAETIGAIPIWLHTHPGLDSVARRSQYDEAVDEELSETFRIRSGSDEYASLVVAPAEKGVRFSGIVFDGDEAHLLQRLFVVGPRWSLTSADDAPADECLPSMYDRQVRAFGGDLQRVLSKLTIGVVGCGGTGSAVAEQLTRLGIRSLILFDPDDLTDSNVTRVYGSAPGDVGRPKVAVLADHLRRIAPTALVLTFEEKITEESPARKLSACDVIFGCTDDNAGRLVLSRLASYYLVPVIDVGVLLSSTSGTLEGIDGRITVLFPGEACLVCRGRVDLARAQAEQLHPAEREFLQAEGYAPELVGIEPSVVAYTSLVASLAVGEMVERLVGYGPEPEPGEILVRCHERELSTNSRRPNPRHYCHPEAGQIGAGDRTPFLGQTWHG
ncbi:MAG: HesA/MoeB/ThiF family protein [Nitrososphaerales archaeon]